MAALTPDQLELLQRALEGRPMWGGSVATDRLRREVALLLAMRLLEPAGSVPYRLTQLGALALAATADHCRGTNVAVDSAPRYSSSPRSTN